MPSKRKGQIKQEQQAASIKTRMNFEDREGEEMQD